ncbi:uncharacterized protein G2W53_015753 [Senna tora]|uniref:Uncharacterized protein n=1 Tax=Senna tora TaxID=362788 RepID=A0A834WVD5_9FABA|nr:uncharacterized protein G2W53_015753 [Senna tora]
MEAVRGVLGEQAGSTDANGHSTKVEEGAATLRELREILRQQREVRREIMEWKDSFALVSLKK